MLCFDSNFCLLASLATCANFHVQVRPRIKGRFATREEVIALKAQKAQQEAQQQFQLQLVDDDCVVPNFI